MSHAEPASHPEPSSPLGSLTTSAALQRVHERAVGSGIQRIHVLAWREFADQEAGGSEVHAHEVLRRWAAAGLEVTIRTSGVDALPAHDERDGYHIIRRGGRYDVFPRAIAAAATGRMGNRDALVEVWNGVPFLSPLWARCPRVVVVHHVHGPMWKMVFGSAVGAVGEFMERRVAPHFYRNTNIVTASASSRDELVHDLGFNPSRVRVAPPGIDDRFRPGSPKSPTPLVVAVGRLVPVKRFDALIRSAAVVHERRPDMRLVIVGEGYERSTLEAEVRRLGAEDWVSLPGRLDDHEVVDLFQKAWVVASSSAVEGWGMTLTEAAACGTPAVATRTTGHLDAVADGVSGLLADDDAAIAAALHDVLTDEQRRSTLSHAALERARQFTWDATAEAVFDALADDAQRRAHIRRRS